MAFLNWLKREPLYWLLAALPVAVGLDWSGINELWVFILAGVAIIPLAGLMGRATENLAERMGPGIGGLLNATFGNAAELIIAFLALQKGPDFYPLVKASITGSIVGNILLILGISIFAGGIRYPRQTYNATAVSLGSTLMGLAAIGLVVPAIYVQVAAAESPAHRAPDIAHLSEEISAILIFAYLASLFFSLKTHRHLFAGDPDTLPKGVGHHSPEWGVRKSLILLVVATVGVAWMAELLIGAVEHASEALGMTKVFVGVIVIAIVGNAAEHSTAVLVAMKNKMDLTFAIAIGSGMQVALLIAPILVFASMFMHEQVLDLHFSLLEVIAVVVSVGTLALIAPDGETHWMEGLLLLAVYVILALAFFHLPEPAAASSQLANPHS